MENENSDIMVLDAGIDESAETLSGCCSKAAAIAKTS
jgi:hypothetical protein